MDRVSQLPDGICHVVEGSGPVVTAAIHSGHLVRPDVERQLALDEDTRLREEDPLTAVWTHIADTRVTVERSRFEVDLNRPREQALYLSPDQAWGLPLWNAPPSERTVKRSQREHDRFYERLARLLDHMIEEHGVFVVYDIHSYNHRRQGPDAAPASSSRNPHINVGTGNLDRRRWGPVVDAFLGSIREGLVNGCPIDARENVKFRGGYLSEWVARNYGTRGCALAIEVKKIYMDEWTGEPDWEVIGEIGAALRHTIPAVVEATEEIRG